VTIWFYFHGFPNQRTKLPGMVPHTCHPSYLGGRGRMNTVWGQGWVKAQDPIWETN
jgi:hypothetical protein